MKVNTIQLSYIQNIIMWRFEWVPVVILYNNLVATCYNF